MVLLILQWCFFHRPYLMIFLLGIWGCFASDLPSLAIPNEIFPLFPKFPQYIGGYIAVYGGIV